AAAFNSGSFGRGIVSSAVTRTRFGLRTPTEPARAKPCSASVTPPGKASRDTCSAQAIARGKREGNAAVKSKVTVLDTKALRQPDRRTLGTGVGRKARTNHNPTRHIFL